MRRLIRHRQPKFQTHRTPRVRGDIIYIRKYICHIFMLKKKHCAGVQGTANPNFKLVGYHACAAIVPSFGPDSKMQGVQFAPLLAAEVTSIHIYVHVYMYINLHIYIYIYIYMYMYMCIYEDICTYVYVYIRIHIYMYTYIYIDIYICTYMYVHIYICIYIHIQ